MNELQQWNEWVNKLPEEIQTKIHYFIGCEKNLIKECVSLFNYDDDIKHDINALNWFLQKLINWDHDSNHEKTIADLSKLVNETLIKGLYF